MTDTDNHDYADILTYLLQKLRNTEFELAASKAVLQKEIERSSSNYVSANRNLDVINDVENLIKSLKSTPILKSTDVEDVQHIIAAYRVTIDQITNTIFTYATQAETHE